MLLVLIACAEPVAHIIASATEGYPPLTVELTAVNMSEGPELIAAQWDLGDGTLAEGLDLQHTWASPGTVPLSLTITDARQRTASTTIPITVYPFACLSAGEAVETGALEKGPLSEVSGVVESRVNDGVLWVHNDSGDAPQLYAISADGTLLSTWALAGAPGGDWEDLAIGVDPETGGGLLYVGDIGDNGQSRDTITIYRVPEPDVIQTDETQLLPWDTLTLTYPDEPLNAETLLLDPLTDDLFIVTKDYGGQTGIFRKAAPHVGGEETVLERVGALDFAASPLSGGATTGGAISLDGTRIVIRTYGTIAYLWSRAPDDTVAAALQGDPCALELPGEQQGEAIGFALDGPALWSISEGSQVPIRFIPLVE